MHDPLEVSLDPSFYVELSDRRAFLREVERLLASSAVWAPINCAFKRSSLASRDRRGVALREIG